MDKPTPILIVGLKDDRYDDVIGNTLRAPSPVSPIDYGQREGGVPIQLIIDYVNHHNESNGNDGSMAYITCSSFTGYNIDRVFATCVRLYWHHRRLYQAWFTRPRYPTGRSGCILQ
jgi:hypothetical protein